jgi:hypothetical protein
MHGEADNSNAETRRYRAGAGGNEHSATGTHRNHDEHHFKSFEKDRLEGRDSRDPVEPRLAAACLFAQFRGLDRERRRLIMERDDPRRTQDRLSQPPHAEQQEQDANDELQEVQRHMIEQGPSAITMSASTARPARTPRPAGRQPRTIATASTIVSASTASTSEARKAAAIAGQTSAKLPVTRSLLCGLKKQVRHLVAWTNARNMRRPS